MAEARLKDRVIILAAVTALLTFGVAILIALSSTPRAQAAPPPAAPFTLPGFGSLGPSSIITDAYESNDSQLQAYNLGSYNQLACPGFTIINNATFYKVGLPNPASDQDWYRVQLGALLNYTLTVMQQSPSDVRFSVLLLDPSSNTLASSTGLTNSVITFAAGNGGSFVFDVTASNASGITDTEDKPYQVELCSSTLSATPTNTPQGVGPDAYEPNDNIAESIIATDTRSTPSFVAVGSRIDNLNFYPAPEHVSTGDTADWFEFYARGGSIYQITTLNVQPGVETVMAVYKPVANPQNPALALVSAIGGSSNPNNRFQAGQRGSQVMFQTPNGGDGMYWIKITNIDPSPRIAGQTYSLQVQEILQAGPTPTITPFPPTLTPYPGQPDKFEYNGDFDHAALIAPNVTYDGLNFVPWAPPSQDTFDNDFYKLPVKQGIFYTCQTLNLAPGVDTNIIVYNNDRVGIGGNDDISPDERSKGNFSSRFSWLASYTGNAYLLIGEVNPPKADEAGNHTYSLRCDIGLPATATPSVTSTPFQPVTYVPPTPLPPEPTMTPYPTPRSAQNLPVRPVSNPNSTPTPQPTSTPRIVSVNVQIFNDQNGNGLLDPGEGITNVSVHLTDEQSGSPLAQKVTDADGRVSFSVENPGPVRLSVPLFGYSLLINDPSVTVRIAIATAPTLPASIP